MKYLILLTFLLSTLAIAQDGRHPRVSTSTRQRHAQEELQQRIQDCEALDESEREGCIRLARSQNQRAFVPQVIAFLDLGASYEYQNQAAIVSRTTTQLPVATTGVEFHLNSDIALNERVSFIPRLQVFTSHERAREESNYSTGGAQELLDSIAGDEFQELEDFANRSAALLRIIRFNPDLLTDLPNAFGDVHRVRENRPRVIHDTQLSVSLPVAFGMRGLDGEHSNTGRNQFYLGPELRLSTGDRSLEIGYQVGVRRANYNDEGEFTGDTRFGLELTAVDSEYTRSNAVPRRLALFIDANTGSVMGWARLEFDFISALNLDDLDQSANTLLVIRGGFQAFFGPRSIFGLRFDASFAASLTDSDALEGLSFGSTYVDDVPNFLVGIRAEATVGFSARWGGSSIQDRRRCEVLDSENRVRTVSFRKFQDMMSRLPRSERYDCRE